jgi:hypothetical protein
LIQWARPVLRGRAKEVQVIRHDDEPADHPTRRLLPGIPQQRHHLVGGENPLPVLRADGEKDDGGFVEPFHEGQMDRMLSPGRHHPIESKASLGRKRAVASSSDQDASICIEGSPSSTDGAVPSKRRALTTPHVSVIRYWLLGKVERALYRTTNE